MSEMRPPSRTVRSALAVFRRSFQAYVGKDRPAIESILADDFHFTSPLDNRLDRQAYLEICWPNSRTIAAFDEVFASEHGDRACILYEARTTDGQRLRNCEIATVRGEKLVSVEVYFGWGLPHQVPLGQHSAARVQE